MSTDNTVGLILTVGCWVAVLVNVLVERRGGARQRENLSDHRDNMAVELRNHRAFLLEMASINGRLIIARQTDDTIMARTAMHDLASLEPDYELSDVEL